MDKKAGFLLFDGVENEGEEWVRLCLHDEVWLSSLETFGHNTERGFYFEILRYAKLDDKEFDLSLIRRTSEIAKYATLNSHDPSEKLFYDPADNSLLHQDLPITGL